MNTLPAYRPIKTLKFPLGAKTAEGIIYLTRREVEAIITNGYISENPYWRFSNYISKQELLTFFDLELGKISLDDESKSKLLRKIADYILFYVENMTLAVYILAKQINPKEAQDYLKWMQQHLEKLRELHRKTQNNPTIEKVKQMIDTALEISLDPF